MILIEDCGLGTYHCGSILYDIGKVEYLNYGYEIKDDLHLASFMNVNYGYSVEIYNVDFSYNVFTCLSEYYSALILVHDSR